MACTPLETELMQRALHNIDQMLSELQTAATQQQCLPADEFTALPFQRSDYREQPASSAVYFCLTSASALLDVSRSLMDQLHVRAEEGYAFGWDQLSALSKAAGQSAFVAAVMLAGPQDQGAASARQQEEVGSPLRAGPASTRPARPRSTSVGVRLKSGLRQLIDAVAA